MYMKARPEQEHPHLNCTNLQSLRGFAMHQNWEKLVSLKSHLARPVGYHLVREIRDIQSTKQEKMPKMINLSSTGHRRSVKLVNNPPQKIVYLLDSH